MRACLERWASLAGISQAYSSGEAALNCLLIRPGGKGSGWSDLQGGGDLVSSLDGGGGRSPGPPKTAGESLGMVPGVQFCHCGARRCGVLAASQ